MTQKRVLVVDDDPITLCILERALVGRGYGVYLAENGETALKMASRERPDVIILDLLLPGLDGFQVCRRLQQQEDTRDIPIIMLTGVYEAASNARQGIQMGARRYLFKHDAGLGKPIEADEVLRVVDEVLAGPSQVGELLRERIVIVDDDALSVTLLQRHLEQAGYEVLTASDGQSGMDMILREKPDLALLDYHLPGVDGLHILEHARKECPNTVFVIMTAYGSEDTAAQALKLGADDYLVKPFRPWSVTAIVEENLEKGRQRRLTRSLISELDKSNRRLQQQQEELRLRNAALQEANVRLEQLNRLREEFVSMIVHDLRNPLGIIVNALELLGDDLGTVMNEEQRDILLSARRAGMQLTSMVNNLLDVQRLEAGKMPLLVSDVDVKALIDHATQIVLPRLRDKQLTMRTELPAELPPVRADAVIVSRILDNLLDNAIKFTPAGGTITVRAEVQGPEIIISVEDTGEGIPATYRERVFDKFEQLKIIPGVHRGAGLGLTFCKLATEAHGGRIWVEDNEPKGSRFRFSLPLVAQEGTG